jgi:hypothetical protein
VPRHQSAVSCSARHPKIYSKERSRTENRPLVGSFLESCDAPDPDWLLWVLQYIDRSPDWKICIAALMIARYGPWLRFVRSCADACAPSVRVLSLRPTRGGRRCYRQSVCSVDHRVVAEGVIHRRSSTLRSNGRRSIRVHQHVTTWDGPASESAFISDHLFLQICSNSLKLAHLVYPRRDSTPCVPQPPASPPSAC